MLPEDICAVPNGIKGAFDGNIGAVSRRRLGDMASVVFHGSMLKVRGDRKNAVGDGYALIPVEPVRK